jgi:hypothetical protein
MSRKYKFILDNKSSVNQTWQIYPHEPAVIEPGHFISYEYTVDTERQISIGLLIDVVDSQLATAVKRDAGEDSKFYLFPASHEIAVSTYTVTVYLSSTYEGEETGFESGITDFRPRIDLNSYVKEIEGKEILNIGEMSLDDRLDYINNLEIDFSLLQGRNDLKLRLDDEDKAGLVDSGSLISFVTGLKSQHKEDVLNSTLLAQLAANTAFDRWSDTNNWYKKYVEVLANVAWVIESFSFTQYEGSSESFTMDKVVLEILKAIATGEQEDVINETMKTLEALDDGDGKLVLFDTNASNLKRGNFQMGTCQSDGENVAMSMGTFYFSSEQSSSRFLWFEYKKAETKLFKAGQKVVLNELIYKKVRQTIIDKLGDAATQYVADLDIGF